MGLVKDKAEGTAGGKVRQQIKVICKDRDKEKRCCVARDRVTEKDRDAERIKSGTEEDK